MRPMFAENTEDRVAKNLHAEHDQCHSHIISLSPHLLSIFYSALQYPLQSSQDHQYNNSSGTLV